MELFIELAMEPFMELFIELGREPPMLLFIAPPMLFIEFPMFPIALFMDPPIFIGLFIELVIAPIVLPM